MSRDHSYSVYIVTNHTNTVFYVGVTSNLEGRLWEHANGESGSKFTRKYHVNRLLFCEQFQNVDAAIAREKQLKGWTRAKKEALIWAVNPNYEDLAADWNHGVCRRPKDPSAPLHSAQDDSDGEEDRRAPTRQTKTP